jgi:molybdenum cofactor guanylyltransferase
MGSTYRARLNGLIIAGGQSRRMGADKALLIVNGRPLLAAMIDRMSEQCGRIVVAVGDCERVAAYKEAVLPHCSTPASRIAFAIDRYAGCGPLAGLHAGLAELQDGYALVMGCDMPQLSETLLERMAAAAERENADVAHAAGQPFHAVYHTRVGRQALARLEQEDYRFMRLLDDAMAVQVDPQTEEERLAFLNLNSPEAYQAYRDQTSDG